MLPLALGTQTAGSIIRPAAYCGVVGYKPSLGRVPRAGVKSLSDTLDVVGSFGRSVEDAALLGAVLTGDARLLDVLNPGAGLPLAAVRVGLCGTPDWAQADADVQAAWAHAERVLGPACMLGSAAWPAEMPDLVALQKRVMGFEMARALRSERVLHGAAMSQKLRALLDDGMVIDGAQHAADCIATAAARRVADAWFADHDVLLSPSAMGEAPEGTGATGDPLFCRGWTLLGLPCVHLPFGQGAGGMPVGLQLVGRWGSDHLLLAVAKACMQLLAATPT
jgi:Asp-tRNA(Asn)/Glu-tRNA(Gln) amidotransferase A subunit family amidase